MTFAAYIMPLDEPIPVGAYVHWHHNYALHSGIVFKARAGFTMFSRVPVWKYTVAGIEGGIYRFPFDHDELEPMPDTPLYKWSAKIGRWVPVTWED